MADVDIKYRGNSIATMSASGTTTLGTQGKYCDSDIVVEYTKPAYDWMGEDAEFVSTILPTRTTLLKDTGFATWTPSATAKVIQASEALATTYTADMANYEYILEWLWDIQAAYNPGATKKAQFYRAFGACHYCVTRRSNNTTSLGTNSGIYNTANSPYTSARFTRYYNTSGVLSIQFALSHTFYPTFTAPTLSDTSSTTPTITFNTPAFNAKCNSSYMSTARAAELDQNNTTIKLKGNLYRVKRETNFMRGLWITTGNLYNNPL